MTVFQRRLSKFSPILLLLLLYKGAYGFDSTLTARLQFTLDSVRISQNFKGISASIIIPGQGTWLGVSGVSYSNVPVTKGMYFGVGSNTKTFMSVLVLKLAEMNLLTVDDSLDSWIPGFQYVDSAITIRQLLNHTSGLFDYASKPGYADSILANPNRFWTPEELLTKFLNPPYFPKGQGFQYSNTNYLVLGMIIKAAIGSQVSVKLRELILEPLNLNNTYFPVEETVPDTIVHPWNNGIDITSTPRISLLSAAWTAGAIYSNSEDMSSWYRLLFGGQVISQFSLSQMLTFTAQSGFAYGLGIAKFSVNGRTLWGHGGSIRGYSSQMLYDTAMKMSITVLLNQQPGNPLTVSAALLNTVVNFPLGININSNFIPASYSLSQNYPNPFNPVTNIKFGIPKTSLVTLKIYDMLGREVAALVNNRNIAAGNYTFDFNASGIPSGVYFYKLTAGDFSDVKKMTLIK